MKVETERIVCGMARANADREPSRLAACGPLQPLEYLHALPVVRMLRPGTGRGPAEDNGQAPSARGSAIVNRKL